MQRRLPGLLCAGCSSARSKRECCHWQAAGAVVPVPAAPDQRLDQCATAQEEEEFLQFPQSAPDTRDERERPCLPGRHWLANTRALGTARHPDSVTMSRQRNRLNPERQPAQPPSSRRGREGAIRRTRAGAPKAPQFPQAIVAVGLEPTARRSRRPASSEAVWPPTPEPDPSPAAAPARTADLNPGQWGFRQPPTHSHR